MKKIGLFFSFLLCFLSFKGMSQGIVYITDQGAEPWTYNINGGQDNFMALNTTFGNGNYTTSFFQNAVPNNIFTNSNCFILIEGGAQNDVAMNNFVTANQLIIQNWVNNGGHLMLESAGWNCDINCGFSGVVITLQPQYIYGSGPGAVSFGQGAHPIFNNGIYPSGTSWTGNYFTHDIINGPAGTSLITASGAQGNQIGLTELSVGCGKVFFSGITFWGFHNPQPAARNLSQAMFAYLYPCLQGAVTCPVYLTPANHSTEPNCHGPVLLSWNPGAGGCGADSIHYLLSFGTNNPPNNIINGQDIGPNPFYVLTDPPITLTPGQTYYWQIDIRAYGGALLGGDTTIICNTIWDFTLQGPPPPPGPIAGPTNLCEGTTVNFSVPPNGQTYNWTVPAGTAIIAGQGTDNITVIVGANSGNVCVDATDQCGTSAPTCIPITVSLLPVLPCPINGPLSVCPNQSFTYNCSVDPSATNYIWSLPAGWVITAGAGTASITVTTGNVGDSICVTTQNLCGLSPRCCIYVAMNPNLQITASNDTAICSGGAAPLSAFGAANTYTWSPSQGLNTTNGPNVIATPATTTKYYVTGNTNGCTGTDSVTVVVSQPMVVAANLVNNVNCPSGSDGSASASVSSGGIPLFNYSWNTNPIQTTAVATNMPGGNYTVTITDSAGCSATANITITAPTPFVVVTDSVPVTCNGGTDGSASVVSVSGGATPYNYSWNSNPVQNTQTATGLPAGTYIVTITDANNCQITDSSIVTEPTQVTVLQGSNSSICVGQNANLTAAASGGIGPYTYVWNPGALNGANQVVSPNATTVYTVVATDANNCASAPQTITVTVNSSITVICSKDTTICAGGMAHLGVNASGGDGNLVYNWTPTGGGFPNPNVQPAVTTTYVCTVTDGCGTPAGVDSVVVTVIPLPQITFTSDITSGCTPACVTFTDQTVVGAGASLTNWLWDFGDGSTSSQQNPQHCFTPGIYDIRLTVTDNIGCTNTSVVQSMIKSYAYPVAEFVYGPQPTDILSPDIAFTDKSQNAVQWHWNFGDNSKDSVSDVQHPLHSYGDTGRYCVSLTVTSLENCVSRTTNCLIINDAFTLFIPNAFTPNGDLINDGFIPKGKGIKSDGFEMLIYDRWGNMIYKTTSLLNGAWNGTIKGGSELAIQDVYVYRINATDVFDRKHTYTGDVTLVR